MNIRDLEYLIAVADLGHFGKAAEKCFVSQPTLSMQIKKLEQELGIEVFERSNKRVLVTPLGKEIIEQARGVLLAAEELKELAKRIKDPWGGVFRLGIIPTVGPYLLPHILPLIRTAFPQLLITVVESKTDALISLLHKGELDAVIASTPIDLSYLKMQSLFQEPFYAVFNQDHPLQTQQIIRLEDLHDQNVLLLEEGHCLREQVLDACLKEKARKQNNNFSLTSLETLYYIIALEGGISLFPSLAIKMRQKNPHIVVRSFAPPAPSREIALFWRNTSYRNPLCIKIAECITLWSCKQMF